MNIKMECHKVDRVTGAGENGKVEWPVAVTEECLMQLYKSLLGLYSVFTLMRVAQIDS